MQIPGTAYPAGTAYYYLQDQDFNLHLGNCNDAITFKDVTESQANNNAENYDNDNRAATQKRVKKKVTIKV